MTAPAPAQTAPASSRAAAIFEAYHKPITAALIVVAVLLVYSRTSSYPFHLDGAHYIENGTALRDVSAFWPPLNSRSVGYLTFAVNYQLADLEVFSYHLVNMAVHAVNGVLIAWLVLVILRTPVMRRLSITDRLGPYLALVASLIFVVHPAQTQAVTYIIQRVTSLATLFYVLALVLYLEARLARTTTKGACLCAAAFLSAMLAMLTKEISFTLPFVILLCDLVLFEQRMLERRRVLYFVPLLLTVFIIPLSFLGASTSGRGLLERLGEAAQETEVIPRGRYLATQFRVIVTYIRLLFIPVSQNLDYDYPIYRSVFDPAPMVSFLFLLAIGSAALYLLLRSRGRGPACGLLAAMGILWFLVTLSVESSVIPIRDVINEHRMYLPSVGAVIAFAAAAFYGFERVGKRISLPAAAALLVAATVVPLAIVAARRNGVWKDAETLWKDVIAKSPRKARGYFYLGYEYEKQGRLDEALSLYETAVRLQDNYPEAHSNLGALYCKTGRVDDAIRELEVATGYRPDYAKAHNNLGLAYAGKGDMERAIEEYGTAIKLEPELAEAHHNLGLRYLDLGQNEKAAASFRKAIELKPWLADAHCNLGVAYHRLGDIDTAIEAMEEALRLRPSFLHARKNLDGLRKLRMGSGTRSPP